MKNKQIEMFAKKLFKKSLSEDHVDPKKVKAIIDSLNEMKPQRLLEIYLSYLNLIELKIEGETAYIETPFAPDKVWANEIEREIRSKFPQVTQIRFLVNPHLIAGLKVKIADMVYENSFKAKLEIIRNLH